MVKFEMETKKNESSNKIFNTICAIITIVLIIFIVVELINCTKKEEKYYNIKDVMIYDDLELVVNNVSDREYATEEFNGYLISVNFTVKNNGTSEFKLDPDRIYLKTEDRGEKYKRVIYLGDTIFYEEVLPGGTHNYSLSYKSPYQLTEKNYVIVFDLKLLHGEVKCRLYNDANDSQITKNLSITYLSNDGNNNSFVQYVTYDSSITLKNTDTFNRKGYTLSSWNTKADGTGTSYLPNIVKYSITENVKLYAQWTINQYAIKVNKNIENAGSIIGDGTFDYNTNHILSVTTNTGYTWLGWYDNKEQLLTTSTDYVLTLSDSDIIYNAKWKANDYLLTLDVNNGDSLSETDKIVTFSNNFNLIVPTRSEADFIGWFYNDIQYTNSNGESIINWNIPNDATLIAHWNIHKYQVSLTQNIDNGGSVIGAGNKEYGSIVEITARTNNGYTFVGWYNGLTQLTTNPTYYFTMSNIPVTYTAKWTANKYILTYNVNGGNELPHNSKEVIFDCSFTLDTTIKDGYSFGGWYTGKEGTGEKLTDENGNSLSAWNIPNDVTVYAKWNLVTYTLSYSLNDGVCSTQNRTTYTIEDLDIAINNPYREGYNFIGWIGTDINEKTMTLTIHAGSFGDRHFGACWEKSDKFVAISTPAEFLNIADNLNGYYYLIQDIDMTGFEFSAFGDAEHPFTGVLDGCGFEIKNISNIFYSMNGFVYNLKQNGNIATVNGGKISQCHLNINSLSYGVVEINNGIINNCKITGKIREISTYPNSASAAGICLTNNNTISNCFVEASVTADGGHVSATASGITTYNNGYIENCIIAGDIFSYSKKEEVGLPKKAISSIICAYNDGKIMKCYNLDTIEIIAQKHSQKPYGVFTDTIIRTNSTSISLLNLNNYFNEYQNTSDLILHANNVWIFTINEYPKLFWEN